MSHRPGGQYRGMESLSYTHKDVVLAEPPAPVYACHMNDEPRKTGKCWCGCNEDTDSYFVAGHDQRVRSWLLEMVYGTKDTVSILDMLHLEPWRSGGIRARISAIRESKPR